MKQKLLVLANALLLIFLFSQPADARQGCCSHHGGVCGCAVSGQKCCDGSPLSSTCAPYYDRCVETPPPPTPTCEDKSAGTCDGKEYNQCEQAAYDECVQEENFWKAHNEAITNAVKEYLCREATEDDLKFYGNYSRDIDEIIALMKDSDEYKECHNIEDETNQAAEESTTTKVVEITDGDTIKIEGDEKVRLVGIDTPETKDPRKTVECFGQEASDYLKSLIDQKEVELKKDNTSDDRDKYDRLIRYVYLNDEDINAKMIEDGYAYAYTEFSFDKSEEYTNIENEARENNRGLWSEDTCNGEREISTVQSENTSDIDNAQNESNEDNLANKEQDRDSNREEDTSLTLGDIVIVLLGLLIIGGMFLAIGIGFLRHFLSKKN